MAKKATRKPAAGKRSKGATKSRVSDASRPIRGKVRKTGKAARARAGSRRKSEGMGAADALVGLLESPLVAEVIAAGAAAALATITQQALSKKPGGSTKTALKEAAKSAAAAMGARLSTEFDEILKSAKAGAKAEEA